MTAHEGLRTIASNERTGGLTRMMESLRQTFCGLSGHDTLCGAPDPLEQDETDLSGLSLLVSTHRIDRRCAREALDPGWQPRGGYRILDSRLIGSIDERQATREVCGKAKSTTNGFTV